MGPSFYFHPRFGEQARLFFEHYDLETEIVCPEKKMVLSILKKDRVCRFCNKKEPEVKFKNAAHVIPESLGNRYLISAFECDTCNTRSGRYDDHLSHFLGVSRTLNKTRGKEKVPTFKSPDKNIRAEQSEFYGIKDAITISRENVSDESFSFDPSTGMGKLTFKKASYIPLLVYKSVLKMALTCVNGPHAAFYQLAIRYLMSNQLDNEVTGVSKLYSYHVPLGMGWEVPFAAIYKKKDLISPIPTHIFMIYFQNTIFQLFIPLHLSDIKLLNNKTIPLYWCPPLFGDLRDAFETPVQIRDYDLTSTELVKGEEETIVYKLSPDDLSKIISRDPETGEISDKMELPRQIAKMVLVKPGTVINFEK